MNKNVRSQSNILYRTLKKEIDGRNCCLLDLPNYYNPGDQLIWEGEEQLLKKIGINVTYRSSLHFFNSKMVKSGDCILLQGGGNFGDLYSKHQKFREEIVRKYPNNKIIILPVTIYFTNNLKAKDSFKKLSVHSNLIICVRDNESYDYLLNNFPKDRSRLLPDTAMAINNIRLSSKRVINNEILYLSRTDIENKFLSKKVDLSQSNMIDKSDWSKYSYTHLIFNKIILFMNIHILYI